MKKMPPNQHASSRFSVRASITVWMLLAGFIWVALGLAVTYASHWGEDSLEAEAHRLSTIVPAAGSQAPAAGSQNQ